MISVVSPVYNVKKYIDRGINCVLSQTFQDIEYFLVDDGSTDGSYELCLEWEQKDSRIHVLHQENKGAGAARQNGIDNARGEYVWFFDLDDECESTLLERCNKYLDGVLEELQFGYDTCDDSYKVKEVCQFPSLCCDTNEQVKQIYVEQLMGLKFLNGFVWNKIFKVSFLRECNIRFQNQKIQQDEVFNLIAYHHVNHLKTIPDVLYHYYIYYKGNTRSYYIPDRIDIYRQVRNAFLDLYNDWNLQNERMLSYVYHRHIHSVISALNFNLLHSNTFENDFNLLINDPDFQDSLVQIEKIEKRNIPFLRRLYFFFLKNKKHNLYRFIFWIDQFVQKTKSRIRKTKFRYFYK